MEKLNDITYEVRDGAAIVTIDRPERYNAFRARTVEELIKAFRLAWADRQVRSVILTGAGDKAFCTGGDVKQRAETGDYGPSESGMFEIGYLHKLIRDIPKPVIAAVNGVAVGRRARAARPLRREHRQRDRALRPDWPEGRLIRRRVRVGLPGPGGRREAAREIWFWCRSYGAQEALAMGLVNKVVPAEQAAGRGAGWAARGGREEPDRDSFPQAVVQRRHRPSGGPVEPGDVRARPVHRLAGGT